MDLRAPLGSKTLLFTTATTKIKVIARVLWMILAAKLKSAGKQGAYSK